MARKTRRQRRPREAQQEQETQTQQTEAGWIGRRTGLWIISALSLALGLFMGAQVMPVGGLQAAVLWSLGAALSIWLAFFFTLTITAWIRGRKG